jgi:uncharacterized protein YcbX
MKVVGVVERLQRFPVKSMLGERLPRVTVTQRGIPGDRGWALFDEQRGGITGAKRLPGLRHCRARYEREPVGGEVPPHVVIELPGGTRIASDAAGASERLSAFLARAVTLRSLQPSGIDAPRITMASETPEVARALMGLVPGEPEADMGALSGERLARLRQGNFFDAYPLHVLSTTTLRTLATIAPASLWDVRRFRPNVLISLDAAEGFPEHAWVGRRIRIGSAVIEVAMGCPRCVMATQAVDELPHDPGIMRTLVRESKHNAGIYASIVEPGEAREGDEVRLLD